ncbi:MAG TPA: hypothetical protein VLK82_26075 [Candidatus Tectomicrobia bacterium]|nr:hypothetical protein [Candidatus Tectomicrobia bacterium]
MGGFLRRLFGGGPSAQTSRLGDRFFLDIECERCGERFHLHINRATDCVQVYDESGIAWRLQREVVGARCRTTLQVRIDIAPGGRVVHREVLHGRFLTEEETTSAP